MPSWFGSKMICVIVLSICLVTQGIYGQPIGDRTRPNVLLILVDDLNDWVGCMEGHPNAKTPSIDALAARSVLFTNAHCQAPICGPSRASLMTGLYPTTTGIYGQINDQRIKQANHAASKAIFLPEYFEMHGYHTLGAGKLFHNGDRAEVFNTRGPGYSFGPKPRQRMAYDPSTITSIGSTQTDWGAFPDHDAEMPDHDVAQFAIRQLGQAQDTPFFMAIGFTRPHVPWHVPQAWFDKHPIESIQLPPYLPDDYGDISPLSIAVNNLPAMPTAEWLIENRQWHRMVQAYLACTTFVDAQIGKVLLALQNSPFANNTIVVLASDHGYHLGEKNRVAKQALWTRATRIPLMIHLPRSNHGGKCSAPVGLIDLYPTFVDLCGLPANLDNEGHSLVPLLNNVRSAWPHLATISYGQHNTAVQSERFRYIRYEDGSEELYDHHADPNEWRNVANVTAMRKVEQEMSSHIPTNSAPTGRHVTYPANEYFMELTEREKSSANSGNRARQQTVGQS